MTMTAKQRYKNLSHARRSLRRNNVLHLKSLMNLNAKNLRTNTLIKNAMSLAINQPIVVDMHFHSDCIFDGMPVKAGTVMYFKT